MIRVWVDGLCEPVNPGGVACWGLVIRGKQKVMGCGVVGSGPGVSNNVAEYAALVKALETLVAMRWTDDEIVVYSDSQLLVNQMSGRWQARGGMYYAKYLEAKELVKQFSQIRFEWIPREQNEEADALSRKAYETFCEATGVPIRYMQPRKRASKSIAECCLTCRWAKFRGPHIGCYYGGKWRKWIPKRFARSNKCERYEATGETQTQ